MKKDALSTVNTRNTPQNMRARGDQIKNAAGGYVFKVDDWGRALRFLILGTDGGTYYTSEQDLTLDNAQVIMGLAATQGEQLVKLIVDVSEAGRAPRQNPCLFALAICTASADDATRKAAVAAIPKVCRIGTHLFIFARYVEQFRGWGRGLRNAVGNWYLDKPVDDVAYQAVKYRQREGWSHRDLLRLSHPRTSDPVRKELFKWITHPDIAPVNKELVPSIIKGFKKVQSNNDVDKWVNQIEKRKLPWEALPDNALTRPEVWEALLPNLGITALIRNLGRLTNLNLISPMGGQNKKIIEMLTNETSIKKGRLHPLSVLVALATYANGHGFKGSQTWTPVPAIVDALNEAFYISFGAIEPANKRTLVGLDVSGSMTGGNVCNSPLVPFEAEAALAMVALRSEPEVFPMAFSEGFIPLALSKTQRLDDVLRVMRGLDFSRTDCSVPMQWAAQNKVPVDTFTIYTDNETWVGNVQPFQALRRYRDIMGIPAKLVVVGMTSTGFSIADPEDQGMLDVVGMDTATPNVISAFSRGDL